jgi:hypothetical protein
MRRFSTLLVAGGGTLLFVSLFFDWYRDEPSAIEVDGRSIVFYESAAYSGWNSFEIADIVLALCAVLAVAMVVAPRRLPDRTLLLVAGLAVVIVAVQLVDFPPVLQLLDNYNALDVVRETGAWLGLGGSLALLSGAVLRRATTASAPRTAPGRGAAGSRLS